MFQTAKKSKISNKVVDDYAHALEFVSDCYKSQKMSNVNASPSVI